MRDVYIWTGPEGPDPQFQSAAFSTQNSSKNTQGADQFRRSAGKFNCRSEELFYQTEPSSVKLFF